MAQIMLLAMMRRATVYRKYFVQNAKVRSFFAQTSRIRAASFSGRSLQYPGLQKPRTDLKSLTMGAASIIVLAMICYYKKKERPLMLDSRPNRKSVSFEAEYDIGDLSPWVPYSMEHIEEYLRLRQHSVLIGASSGILRLDVAQSESNSPVEDTMDHAAIVDDDRQWFALGAYDGHWWVLRRLLYITMLIVLGDVKPPQLCSFTCLSISSVRWSVPTGAVSHIL